MRTPRRTALAASGLVLAALLVGCGDDAPTWGAVDVETCGALDLPALVATAFPDAGPVEVTPTARTRGDASSPTSEAVCAVRSDDGDLEMAVELESTGTSGETDLYSLRDGGEISVGGERVTTDPVTVDGWWQEGVLVSASAAGAVSVQLTVADDNLTVAVRVSDRRSPPAPDQDADEALARAVVDAAPDVVPARDE